MYLGKKEVVLDGVLEGVLQIYFSMLLRIFWYFDFKKKKKSENLKYFYFYWTGKFLKCNSHCVSWKKEGVLDGVLGGVLKIYFSMLLQIFWFFSFREKKNLWVRNIFNLNILIFNFSEKKSGNSKYFYFYWTEKFFETQLTLWVIWRPI